MGACLSNSEMCIEQHQTSTNASDYCDEADININSFKLGSYLGVGGSGVVKTATKISGRNFGRVYALKSLSKSYLLRKQHGPDSAMNELKILVTIAEQSPPADIKELVQENFIANVHYAFQDDYHLYFVLDHASNGDMRHNLGKYCSFDENTVQFFAAQIFMALNTCHNANILHRDVKPENVLLTRNGYIKLTDFGVSKILSNVDRCFSTSGTHGYMAPEVYLAGYGHFHGKTADYFSAGVMLYECLLGKRPFCIDHFKSIRSLGAAPGIDLTVLWKSKHVSIHCKQFISHLLMVHHTHRPLNFLQIKSHPWFLSTSFDWSAVVKGTMRSPIVTGKDVAKLDVGSRNVQLALMKHKSLHQKIFEDNEQNKFKNFKYPVDSSSLTLECNWVECKDKNLSNSTITTMFSPLPTSTSSNRQV